MIFDEYKRWLYETIPAIPPFSRKIIFLFALILIILPILMCSWGYCNVPLDYILIGEAVGIIYFFVVIVPFTGYMRDIRKNLEKQKQKKASITYDWWIDLCIGKITYFAIFLLFIVICILIFGIELTGDSEILIEFALIVAVILIIGMVIFMKRELKNKDA